MKKYYLFATTALLVLFFSLFSNKNNFVESTSKHRNIISSEYSVGKDNLNNQQDQGSCEIELQSVVFESVDDLKQRVNDVALYGSSDASETSARLDELIDFFAPDDSVFTGYRLLQIEVLPEYIIYYFMPDDVFTSVQEGQKPPFQYASGITVKYCRDRAYTLESLSSQIGIEISENRYLYDPNRGDISFTVEDSLVTIHVPESLKQYEELKNMCVMEEITIDIP